MLTKPIIITGNPAWLPESLRHRKEDIKVSFRFSKPERKIFRKRKKIPVSDWAERHRIVTRGPLEGTRFKKDTARYLTGMMDASFFPSVEEIVGCMADQTGKSFFADTCIGYAIDRDPGPVLYVYPDEDTATENSKDRIRPMITESPRLRSYLTGSADDEAAKRINLQHMQIYMAWARSAIKLANKSIKHLVLDEVDKYPETAGKKEAGPIDKAEKRTRTYRYSGRKTWKISTPTVESGPIWQALQECQVIFDYYVCCPDCGNTHYMEFEQIKWPEDERDPQRIENQDLAWYECPACRSKWTDLKRDAAVRWGEWRARQEDGKGLELFKYLNKYKPKKIGLHLPSWISHFVGLSEVAAAFLKGLTDKNKFKDFQNSHRAVPWMSYSQERKEDRILALRDDRPRGMVPAGGKISCLLAGVDTQDDGFWYEIRAFGWGQDLESWQIREGFVPTFGALEQLLFEDDYKDVDGKKYHVQLIVQDAMGHRTSEVYDFSRGHRGFVLPYQGKDHLTQPYTFSNIDFYPGTKKPIPGGVRLLKGDATYFKNQLAGKLETLPDDPGAWHLHSECTDAWAQHMCAEYQDEKGLWQCPPHKPNHGWDCSYMVLVAADVYGVKFRSQKSKKKSSGEKTKTMKRKTRRW